MNKIWLEAPCMPNEPDGWEPNALAMGLWRIRTCGTRTSMTEFARRTLHITHL